VLLTRTNAVGAPIARSQKRLEAEIGESGTARFKTTLVERQAYKAMFNERLALDELSEGGNLSAAIGNANQLVDELVHTLTSIETGDLEAA
jgi:chromosome partitioning protein